VGGDAGGAGTGGGTGGAQFCGQVATTVPLSQTADVLVVFDRSSSMNDDTNGNSCPGWCGPSSKWEVMGAALDQLVNTNRSVNWGITYYPSDGGCGVTTTASVDVGANTGLAIEASLGSSALLPAGDAPTAAAISAAVTYLHSRLDRNPKYILLATDGRSGCGSTDGQTPDTDAMAAISAAYAVGIPTFVAAVVPVSDTATISTLAQLAAAGGESSSSPNGFYTIADFGPQFPPVATPANPTGSCQLPLPFPATPAHLVVGLVQSGTLVTIPQDPSNGWWFASSDGTSIVFNGSSCSQVAAAPGGQIDLAYNCGAPPGLAP
jgi:hypothetical protein